MREHAVTGAATARAAGWRLDDGGRGKQESGNVLVFARFRPQDSKEEHSGGEIKAKFTSNESCSCYNDDGNAVGENPNPKSHVAVPLLPHSDGEIPPASLKLPARICMYPEESLGGAKVTRLATSDSRPGAAFTFDRIFEPGCSQQLVFDTTTKPVLEDMLSGYYATVFAYGQTGSGKTFTMEVRRRCSVLHPTRSPHPERLQRRQQPPAETSRGWVRSSLGQSRGSQTDTNWFGSRNSQTFLPLK